MGCCHEEKKQISSCHPTKGKRDWLFLSTGTFVAVCYLVYLISDISGTALPHIHHFTHNIFDLMNTMALGLILGMVAVGILGIVPRELVMSVIGSPTSKRGILKATFAGLLLDLCNHGILLVAMQLYRKGASLAQVLAFLIASPWNSFSLTLILFSLIGIPYTLSFIVLSGLIALTTGFIVRVFLLKGKLPSNPNQIELPENYPFWENFKSTFRGKWKQSSFYKEVLTHAVKDSKMILKWIFLGTILTSATRQFISAEQFAEYLGPSIGGLGITLIAATVMELCSEGSSPLAADLVTRAHAPGNGFAFLMTGAATDYTEIASLRETTGHWSTTLILPLLTVPQVVFVSWLINTYH